MPPTTPAVKRVYEPDRHVVFLKGTPEYKAWFNGLAEHLCVPNPTLAEQALKALAATHGFRPPPRRLPR